MIKKELISQLTQDYYQLVNYLLDDQLQSMQLIIDVTTGYLVQGNEDLLKLDQRYYETQFLKNLVELAVIRSKQLSKNVDVETRATFALMKIFNYKVEEVSLILGIDESLVIEKFERERFKVNLHLGQEVIC